MNKYLLGIAAASALTVGVAGTANAQEWHHGGWHHGGDWHHRDRSSLGINFGFPVGYYDPYPYYPPVRVVHRRYYNPYYVERPVAYYPAPAYYAPAPYYGPSLGLSVRVH